MNEATIKVGPVQASIRAIGKALCWPLRQAVGMPTLTRKLDNLTTHVSALTDILHILIGDLAGSWSAEKRERVQRAIVDSGLSSYLEGNPLTIDEVQRLRKYTQRAQRGGFFPSQEAWDFKSLSERIAYERGGQEWVTELLKLALFIFALYSFSELLKPKQDKSYSDP